MLLSRYFKREEFACKCGCGFATVDAELLAVVTSVRIHFDSPVTINSACRCLTHNEKVQREANKNYSIYTSKSKHMLGIAADIVVKGVEPSEVYEFLIAAYPGKYGIGKYNSFTHIDVRTKVGRW